jgi:hypothetical protein
VGIAYRTHPGSGLTISVIDGEVTEDDFREVARRQGDDGRPGTLSSRTVVIEGASASGLF